MSLNKKAIACKKLSLHEQFELGRSCVHAIMRKNEKHFGGLGSSILFIYVRLNYSI